MLRLLKGARVMIAQGRFTGEMRLCIEIYYIHLHSKEEPVFSNGPFKAVNNNDD